MSPDGFIPPHGNYRELLSYQKAEVVYDLTYRFCQRFLSKSDRTVDQMVQAARSGKQNISEGSKASGTSKETELKLTNVARASLEELLNDYEDFLRVRDLQIWQKDSKEAKYVRNLGNKPRVTYETFREFVETRPPEIVANIAICLVHQANYLLDQQIRRLEQDFLKEGGLRERNDPRPRPSSKTGGPLVPIRRIRLMPTVLAIDQSTPATKAVLFDAKGTVLDKASRDHRQIYPQPGWVEHDAEEIWRNVLAVIREVAGRSRKQLSQLVCLSITNQRETVLVFDRKTGKPLHNAIVWQCRRGDAICQKLIKQGHHKLVRRKTGLKIDTYFSASKLKWLMAEKPAIAAKLKSGHAVIGTIDAYLVHRFTGGKVFATDFTNASRTLLFDIGKLRWDAKLCKMFSVPMGALPEIRESSAQFGETDAGGILPKCVPIIGVMGDSQASLFAQRCYQPGMAKATFGTGTSVLLNIGKTPRVSRKGAVTALAWVWRGQPTYAFEGIISFSAATIEWLKNQLGLIQSTAEVEALAMSVADNGGVYLVPAFAGLSAPYWSPDARAAIVGMTAHTRKGHIVRAALESIAYQIRDVLDMMRADSNVRLRELHADGGPTRNKFLMQFTADMTQTELRVSEVAESSAWGAAMGGLLGLGICKSLEELATLPRDATTFRPKMDGTSVRRLYGGWLAAVKRVL